MENFSVSNVVKLMPLLIIMLVLVIPEGEGGVLKEKEVRVQNNMGEDVTLMVHCRSKDDDIGVHYLSNGNYTQWPFKDSLISTIFWCTVKWNGKQEDFTVYDSMRDGHRCPSKCWWSARLDGAYCFNEKTQQYEKMHPWKK